MQVRLNHKRALGEMEYRDRARKQPYVYSFLKIPPRETWKVPLKGNRNFIVDRSVSAIQFVQCFNNFVYLFLGRIDTGMENFQSSLKYFKWMSIYVVPHTHRAILFVVRECQKVAQMSLFTTSYGKNVILSEFHEIQTQTTNNVSYCWK